MTSGGTPLSSVDIQRGTAEVLALYYPYLWPKLQAQHVPDDRGRCAACRWHRTGAPRWPCTLRLVADEAEWIARARRQGPPGATAARTPGVSPSR